MRRLSRPRRPARLPDSITTRLTHLEAAVGKLTRARGSVRREEHEEVLAALDQLRRHTGELAQHTHDLEVQFKRIAQIQADLDLIKRVRRGSM